MNIKQALLKSSVLRPYFHMEKREPHGRLERLIAAGELKTSAAEVAATIYRNADTMDSDSLFRSVFHKAMESRSEALALVGELFIETPHRCNWASESDIKDYFLAVRREGSIIGEYSAARYLLSDFLARGDHENGRKCLRAFYNCMRSGHLVSGVSYAYWKELIRRGLGRKRAVGFSSIFPVSGALLYTWFSLVSGSYEHNRKGCYFWRYGDLEMLALRKTEKIDLDLSRGKILWNPEAMPSIRGMKIKGEPVRLDFSRSFV